MTQVHLLAPAGLRDVARPSGGNRYDLRLVDGLAARGWRVEVTEASGDWPAPGATALTALDATLAAMRAGARVVVDGLVGAAAGPVLARHQRRLDLTLLVHMPLEEGQRAAEAAAVTAVGTVVVTSDWTRRHLLERHPALDRDRIVVATPGVDPAPVATATADGGRLLTVAAAVPAKGHDLVASALAGLAGLGWQWTCVGSLELDPTHVRGLRDALSSAGVADRVRFTGPLSGTALEAAYAGADLLVMGTRREAYGMVIGEALARGIPVVATAVGGVREAIGAAPGGEVPGRTVAPGDVNALREALHRWLADPGERARLRSAARDRRSTLAGWDVTVDVVERVLRR